MTNVIEEALSGDELTLFRTSLERGGYSVLLGAGASCTSLGRDGAHLPLGRGLVAELADRFGLPDSYGLPSLAGAIKEPDLHDYLSLRFSGCKASEASRLIPSFIWRRIFTYNIDDVLDDAYRDNDSGQQTVVHLTHRDPYCDRSEPGQVQAVYLHGYVNRPADGYVFSTREYAEHVDEHSVWQYIFADELASQPFLIVGCALAEFDLEVFLKRRSTAMRISARSAPSLFITKDRDRVVENLCERHGLTIVCATADDFLRDLDRLTPSRPNVLDVLRPAASRIVTTTRSLERVFFSQWEHAGDALIRTFDGPPPPPLLTGAEPTWEHLRRGQILPRADTSTIAAEIVRWAKAPNQRSLLRLCYAPAGAGKSCVLYALGRLLSEQGVATYKWCGESRIPAEDLTSLFRETEDPIVLMVDQIGDHIDQVSLLLDALNAEARASVLVVGCDREVRRGFIDNIAGSLFSTSSTLSRLSADEALLFAESLRRDGLLGELAGKGDRDIANRFTGKDLVTGLLQAGRNDNLDQRIESEVQQLGERARAVYATTCLAHRHGHPLRLSVLASATKSSLGVLAELLNTDLRGLVFLDANERALTRHRVVAEQTYRHFGDANYGYRLNLARAIRPYVSRASIKQQISEARLAGRVFDCDELVEHLGRDKALSFYEETGGDWQWNSRYWEQRALCLLPVEPALALRYAEQAAGIEHHPMPLTTLPKIRLGVAKARLYARYEDRQLVLEGLRAAREAVRVSQQWGRREIHAHHVAVRGAKEFLAFASDAGVPLSTWDGWEVMDAITADLQRVRARSEAATLTREWSEAKRLFLLSGKR
jgi:hypothetical protein